MPAGSSSRPSPRHGRCVVCVCVRCRPAISIASVQNAQQRSAVMHAEPTLVLACISLQCDTIMKLWIAIFVLVAWVQASAGTNQRRSVAIRKVAIVGCGPAGLSLAKCLSTPTIASSPQSLPEVVDVYEGRSNAYQAAMGGGIQLSSGAFVLQQVGLGLDLDKASERIKRVVARDASCTNELFKVDVHKMVSKEIIPPCYSIMRPALQELLLKAISTSTTSTKGCTKVTINTSRKVEEAIEMLNEGKVKLKFADGSETGDYDMVFGADGLNSKILSSAESPSILASYSGIRVVYCVTPPDEGFKFRQVSLRGQFSQYFGDGLYALCATYGDGVNSFVPRHMLAVVYRDPDNSIENSEWIGDHDLHEKDLMKIKDLLTKGKLINVDEVQNLLQAFEVGNEKGEKGSFIDLGVRSVSIGEYTKSWSSSTGRCVLVGDAAHAMAPFLGQGANQALQDSYALAKCIAKVNYETMLRPEGLDSVDLQTKRIKQEMKRYEAMRKPRTTLIGAKAGILGYLETVGGDSGMRFRDNLFSILGKLGVVDTVFKDGAIPRI